ncbi:MAG: transglutaminase-like domain-containing protein, partial [Kangiellaceae bacterium]|nr:transglutaminase-like domain-containing protein [Kangiellaceae bacterium]
MKFTVSHLAKLLLCILLCLSGQIRATAQSESLPFANELTPFEKETLLNVGVLQEDEADSLLALYLIASGDVRFRWQYQSIKKDINRFLKQYADSLNQTDEQKRAQKLHDAMHEYFFLGGSSGKNTDEGYDFDQSKLSAVFDTEKFNCVSSSLLYIVLARNLDLDVKGVVLPSHIFVQLNIKNGKSINIETTSTNGFDVEHDEEFYQRED